MKVVILLSICSAIPAEIVVMTRSGPIKGFKASENPYVESFLGVPFAEPPINDLRFEKPVPRKKWRDVYQATNLPPPCPQFYQGNMFYLPDLTNMSEDCLYLNIWTPMSERNNKPVLVFIHGGIFYSGSTSMNLYQGTNLASHSNAVVVTINYRLGAFGFYVTDGDESRGNMGMYDQLMAIEWVKSNIEFFGGDPDRIVLMGQSAGAYTVALHMLSPLSKHLFQKAVLLSGSAIHPMFFDNNERLLRHSQVLASGVGCANRTVTVRTSSKQVIKCLKSIPVSEILDAEGNFIKTYPLTFYPRVNDAFLPKSTIKLIRSGNFRNDVEVLMGITQNEGSIMITISLADYFGRFGHNRVQFLSKMSAKFLTEGFMMLANVSDGRRLARYYVDSVKNSTSDSYIQALANIVGDYTISCNSVFQADFFSLKGNTVYYYKFDFRSENSPFAEWVGVSHMQDLPYVFGNPVNGNFTSNELQFSRSLMDRLSAFIKTGNPNIPGHLIWPRYHYKNPRYLVFEQHEESIKMGPMNRCEMWRSIFQSSIDQSLIQDFARYTNSNTKLHVGVNASVIFLFLLLAINLIFLQK